MMSNEIKVILEDYKKLAGEITLKLDNTAEYESWLIIQDYVDRFLDYITNLLEENKRLLKQLEDISLDEANIRADILLEQQDYKSRCEKAIEYIKKNYYEIVYKTKGTMENDLLNILGGE